MRAAAISLTVLVLLSYGLNDSGLAIPAIMLALIAITATYLVAEVAPGTPAGSPALAETSGTAPSRVLKIGS
jgi:hypothetical protein